MEARAYPRHLQANRYCLVPGGRDWFKHHGLDWRDFLRNGIPVVVLQQIDDSMAKNVINSALREYENGKR